MTFSLLEMIAVLATIGLVAGLVVFVQLARRLTRTAAELENAARRVNELAPVAQRLLAHGESELEELRAMTRTATQIADHVNAVTGEASTAALNLLRGFEGSIANRYGAIVAGARAGLAVLKRARGNGSHDGDPSDISYVSHAPERMEHHE